MSPTIDNGVGVKNLGNRSESNKNQYFRIFSRIPISCGKFCVPKFWVPDRGECPKQKRGRQHCRSNVVFFRQKYAMYKI